jgi:hypothetical protein
MGLRVLADCTFARLADVLNRKTCPSDETKDLRGQSKIAARRISFYDGEL